MKNKENLPLGQVCNVDSLGRIVIPSLMRKAYKLEKNDKVELIMDDNGIFLRKYHPGCIFCGNIKNITMFKGQLICKDCINQMQNKA